METTEAHFPEKNRYTKRISSLVFCPSSLLQTMRCEEIAAKGRKKLFKALLNEKEERENLDLSACFFLLHLSHTSLCPLNPVPKEPRALTHCSDQGTFTPISVKGEGRIQLSFLSRYFFLFHERVGSLNSQDVFDWQEPDKSGKRW